jgi:hypothetical protein
MSKFSPSTGVALSELSPATEKLRVAALEEVILGGKIIPPLVRDALLWLIGCGAHTRGRCRGKILISEYSTRTPFFTLKRISLIFSLMAGF